MKSTIIFLTSLLHTVLSIFQILRNSSFKNRIGFSPFSGRYDCIVLGNGPSLLHDYQLNPVFFENHHCFCVNGFALSDLFLKTKPAYYVLLDPAYWAPNSSPNVKEIRENIFQTIQEKLNWPMTLIIPKQAKLFLSNHPVSALPNLKIVFFNSTPLKGINPIILPCIRANLGIPWAGTVIIAAIYTALNLGYRKVFLFGADLSWHENLIVTKENMVCLKDKHFYDTSLSHPIPFYADEAETKTFTMTNLFRRLSDIFNGFVEIEMYARYLGSKIYNVGSDSNVDAFARLSLKEAETVGENLGLKQG